MTLVTQGLIKNATFLRGTVTRNWVLCIRVYHDSLARTLLLLFQKRNPTNMSMGLFEKRQRTLQVYE